MQCGNMSHEENFVHYYQRLLFSESQTNQYEKCAIRRKCMAQMFKACAALTSNETTITLLKEKLNAYAPLVDDKGVVNNYAEPIHALIAHQHNECQQWTSHFKNPKSTLSQYFPVFECSQSHCCQSYEVTNEHMKEMSAAQNKVLSNNCDNVRFAVQTPIAEQEKDVGNTICSDVKSNVQISNSLQFGKLYATVSSKFSQSGSQDFLHKDTSFAQKNTTLRNNQEEEPCSWRKGFVSKAPYHNFNLSKQTNPTELRLQSNLQKSDYMNARHNPQVSSGFCTAMDEMVAQNERKWGKNASVNNSVCGYSRGQRRSLGARRGVMNKFIPPSRANEDSDCGGMMSRGKQPENWESEEIFDQRLKNIDPKMVELIRSEIMDCGTTVQWDDIAGLQFAKATIQEIVIWPLLRPEIFTGLRRPPKGILLFGPPGTGKTLIGRCIASQSHSTFFSISASSLTSKWIGDGEKMVRALFAVARCHQPAVVFIDEIDSLLSQRSDSEHESSRRIKTEFLVQLDGATTGDDERILVIGATNRPQELDEAARRRLVKRLYIPLPDHDARRQIVRRLMSKEHNCLSDEEVDELAKLTEGYSGADMKNLCQEASLGPIRSIGFLDIRCITADQVRPITVADFKCALGRVRATVSPGDLDTYIAWDKQYGSGVVTYI